MSDAVLLAQRGIPAVSVGTERYVGTVGRGMARAHGYPDFPIATIPGALCPGGFMGSEQSPVIRKQWVEHLTPLVAKALLAKKEAGVESGKKLQKKPR